MSVAEATPILGLSERQVYTLIATGDLPADLVVRLGRSVKIKRPALMRWLSVPPDGSGQTPLEPTEHVR